MSCAHEDVFSYLHSYTQALPAPYKHILISLFSLNPNGKMLYHFLSRLMFMGTIYLQWKLPSLPKVLFRRKLPQNELFLWNPYLYKSLCSNHEAQIRGPKNVRKSIISDIYRTFWPSSSNPFVKKSKGCEEKASVYFWSFQGWHILENQFWTIQHLQLGHNRWSPQLN